MEIVSLIAVTFLVSTLQTKCHSISCSDHKCKGSGHYTMFNAKINTLHNILVSQLGF